MTKSRFSGYVPRSDDVLTDWWRLCQANPLSFLRLIGRKVIGFRTIDAFRVATAGMIVRLCVNDCFSQERRKLYIDQYYNEDYDEESSQLRGFDLRIAQIGLTKCVPTFLDKLSKNAYLSSDAKGLFVGDINIYKSTHCDYCVTGIPCVRVTKSLKSLILEEGNQEDSTAKKIENSGGSCASVRRQVSCWHSIVISRISRDHFTGRQTGGKYFILIAFNIRFPMGRGRPKPEQIQTEWFQGNPPFSF